MHHMAGSLGPLLIADVMLPNRQNPVPNLLPSFPPFQLMSGNFDRDDSGKSHHLFAGQSPVKMPSSS